MKKGKSSGKGERVEPAGVFLERVAERFRMLGEPMRLRIIHKLFEGERSVGELVVETGGTQANVSRHLQQLERCGMLSRRKAGLQVFYRLEDEGVKQLCEYVCGSVKRHHEKLLDDSGGRTR